MINNTVATAKNIAPIKWVKLLIGSLAFAKYCVIYMPPAFIYSAYTKTAKNHNI
jgi:hypothetical protein